MRTGRVAAALAGGLILYACGSDSEGGGEQSVPSATEAAATTAPPATDDTAPPTTAAAPTTAAPSSDAPVSPPSTGAAPVIEPGDGGDYRPKIDPSAFSSTIDNPYQPYIPGTRWVFETEDAGRDTETITVEVLDRTRTVMGVETTVVHDVVRLGDELIEDTFDWYAQDSDGNVWYFGEDTTAYEDGKASAEGSWEAGVDGALPGIVMPADPQVSDTGYRQEYLPGEAEDMGQVIATDGEVTTPFGDFTDIVVTRDWTPLEPEVVEEKTYARDIGFVREVKTAGETEAVSLIDYTAPG